MNFNVQNATNQLEKYLRTWKESEGCVELTLNDTYGSPDFDLMPMVKVLVNSWKNGRKRQILDELCQTQTGEGEAGLNYLEKERRFALIPNVFWSVEFIMFFVERGMDVNSRDENGDTALHLAVRHAHPSLRYYDAVSVLNSLLNELSADPNIPNLRGDTALYTLVLTLTRGWNDFKLKLINMLRRKGAIMASFRRSSEECKKLMRFVLSTITPDSSSNEDDIISIQDESSSIDAEEDQSKPKLCTVISDPTPPAEQAEILEFKGVERFLNYVYDNSNDSHDGFYYWDQAMDILKRTNLQASQEFLINYAFIKDNLNVNPEARREIFLACLNTIARLSKDDFTKFWNLITTVKKVWLRSDDNYNLYIFHTLTFLENGHYFERIEEFASSQLDHFCSLLNVFTNFKNWINTVLLPLRNQAAIIHPAHCDRISHFLNIVRLAISCFRKCMHETECKNVSDVLFDPFYLTFCYVMTILHCRFNDVIPEATFNENLRLLRKLIGLDVRACNGDSLMHLLIRSYEHSTAIITEFEPDLIRIVLFEFADPRVKNVLNVAGFEPSQYINWDKNETMDEKIELMINLADRGAHIDARNAFGGPTFKEVLDKERPNLSFKYDSLQCACARVLAGSVVPYAERLPKCMVDFIRMHSSYKFYSNRVGNIGRIKIKTALEL